MKRYLTLFIALCAITGAFSGCFANSSDAENVILPKELTQDQESIISLLTDSGQEICLFDFKTKDAYTSVECWVDIYESGELAESVAGVKTFKSEANALDGQMALLIGWDSGAGCSFTLVEDGARVNNTSRIPFEDGGALARASGPISAPVAIEPGKEIVVYAAMYKAGNLSTYADLQRYLEKDVLKEYPAAYVIKCKFE